jgi:hypothetical protein
MFFSNLQVKEIFFFLNEFQANISKACWQESWPAVPQATEYRCVTKKSELEQVISSNR